MMNDTILNTWYIVNHSTDVGIPRGVHAPELCTPMLKGNLKFTPQIKDSLTVKHTPKSRIVQQMHPQIKDFLTVLGGKFRVMKKLNKNTPQIVGFYWFWPPNHGLHGPCLVMNLPPKFREITFEHGSTQFRWLTPPGVKPWVSFFNFNSLDNTVVSI